MQSVQLHPEVRAALGDRQPIVALETAVVSAGLPRTPFGLAGAWSSVSSQAAATHHWRDDRPVNLELMRALSAVVRAGGAVPAAVAVIEGVLHIGLDDAQAERFAADENAGKASITTLAADLALRRSTGTTVSATLAACRIAGECTDRPPIRVFATGGIGGVHRAWNQRPDISADLRALAETPTCVVCSGAKSILDLPATLEALETLGVPLLGYRTTGFPQFLSRSDDLMQVHTRIESAKEIADICDAHWQTLRQRSAVVAAQALPSDLAIDPMEVEAATRAAEAAAESNGIIGPARTPFLLQQLVERTAGRSLRANLLLLLANAKLAAEIAVALAADNSHA